VITVPREDYRESLDALRSDIESMSEDVLDQLLCALDALERDDHELAREVIDGDDRINQQYLNLEGDCVDLIALQQPVASDLRFIVASFKILTDLERIGDLATTLARYAPLAVQRSSRNPDRKYRRDRVQSASDGHRGLYARGFRGVSSNQRP